MADTKIPYLKKTWNVIGGCSPCSVGCVNCWAARMASTRLKHHPLYKSLTKNGKWTGEIRFCTDIGRADILEQPLHWGSCNIGVQFMGDLFHPKVPDRFLGDVFEVIRKTPTHTFMILTKRLERMSQAARSLVYSHGEKYFRHVQWGVTICNQKEADEKIPILLSIPGKRWVSFEPFLGEIDFSDYLTDYLGAETCAYGEMHRNRTCECMFLYKPDFVVIGCESGPKRRPCKREWIISLVEQCKAAGVPWMVKQREIGGKVCHDPEICRKELGV
jgi:protein gp37